MESIGPLLGLIAVGIFYFLPSIYAHQRKHKQEQGIIMLNLFLGWTLIGWVGAAIWASLKND